MIKSYTHRTRDDTPQQWHPDYERCIHCREAQVHSEWAHDDAVEEYYEAKETK